MGRGSSGARQKSAAPKQSAEDIGAQIGAELTAGLTASQETGRTRVVKHVNSEILMDVVKTLNPNDFATWSQPDSITVGNVEFRRFGRPLEETDAKGKTYITTYQATEQATNGEWPVFDIVVKRPHNRSSAKFVYGPLGTRLW